MAEEQIQGAHKEKQGTHFEEGTMHKHGAGEAPAKGNDRTARMGTGSIPKLVLEFAIPSIVGMLVTVPTTLSTPFSWARPWAKSAFRWPRQPCPL